MPDDGDSWDQSRRLIISQLSAMQSSIEKLDSKIDTIRDEARERDSHMSQEARDAVNNINLRLSMLELRAKLWGGLIGMIAGGASTVIVQLLTRGTVK